MEKSKTSNPMSLLLKASAGFGISPKISHGYGELDLVVFELRDAHEGRLDKGFRWIADYSPMGLKLENQVSHYVLKIAGSSAERNLSWVSFDDDLQPEINSFLKNIEKIKRKDSHGRDEVVAGHGNVEDEHYVLSLAGNDELTYCLHDIERDVYSGAFNSEDVPTEKSEPRRGLSAWPKGKRLEPYGM